MGKIIKYVLYDILQNKIIIAYSLFLLLVSISFLSLENDSGKGTLSLLNIILIVLPLVSIVFSTIHFYNSYEFIELLIAQPLPRNKILLSEFLGVCIALLVGFAIGVGLPIVMLSFNQAGAMLLLSGALLTVVFTSLAFWASVITNDKAKGIGISLMLWFYFSLIYDGLVLMLLFTFGDYPLEKAVMVLTALNPVDLGRIMILLKLDASALMGYTGALYKNFFGSGYGTAIASAVMLVWAIVPLLLALRMFKQKDL
ncbi:ABC transporter permease [Sphingobacteriales bacterium UPWRP_1]|nr:ABC transporter permease [Sphingobacteriales bacterium TSM_CSS]PSJ77550.1 ABC transporter permease [Sphingobacteriales bacterium UPWRP_1]